MKSGARKKKYIPTFWEWYDENSKERSPAPYTIEEGRKVYDRLVEQKYDFPFWNE